MSHYDRQREKQAEQDKMHIEATQKLSPLSIGEELTDIKNRISIMEIRISTLSSLIKVLFERECEHDYDDIREGVLYCIHCGESA